MPDSGSSPSDDGSDVDEKELLPAILDDEEDDATQESEPQSGPVEPRKLSNAAVASKGKLPLSNSDVAPSAQQGVTRPSAVRTMSKHSVKASISQNSRWAQLPKLVKAYLKYHRDYLSHHHYAFKYDAGNFLKTTFLEIAMNDDSQALLYAVVAFSAYHHTLLRPDADNISHFLFYYNTSIEMLQKSLSKRRHNVATLLTILQLATIEVRGLTRN